MRNSGYIRPLSVLNIRSDVRAKYGRLSKQTMLRMLTPMCKFCNDGMMNVSDWIFIYVDSNEDLVSQVANPAVSVTPLAEICQCQCEKMSWEEILKRLRLHTVPDGYEYHLWKPGTFDILIISVLL